MKKKKREKEILTVSLLVICLLISCSMRTFSYAEESLSSIETENISESYHSINKNINDEIITMVGGSNSPSGAFKVKKRYVTKFKNKKEIEAAYKYTRSLYNKSERDMKAVDFLNLLSAETIGNPISISVWSLTTAISFLDANNATVQSKIRNSYSVIKSARQRFYKYGAANVKTVLYERPLNGAKLIIYE